jgi:hypothetical protein
MEPETSLRKLIDPRRERIKALLTLNRLDEADKATFKTSLARRLGSDVRPRMVSMPASPPPADQPPDARALPGEGGLKPGQALAPRGMFTRYLMRGEDLCGDHVTLQLNLAHAEFSTYRVETRMVYRDRAESHSEYCNGLVELTVHRGGRDPTDGPGHAHPGHRLLAARVAASPTGGGAVQTVGECLEAARAKARELGLPLQLQIGIYEDAGELYEIPWEFLALDDGTPVAHSEDMLFSRAILSSGSEAVECQTRVRESLRVLAVYSDSGTDPQTGGNPYHQQPIQEQMMRCMAPMAPDEAGSKVLLRPDADVLLDHLSVGSPYDVLYLACEAAVVDNEYCLRFPGRDLRRAELAVHFRGAPIPRLVILVAAHQLADAPEDRESIRGLAHIAALFSRLGAASVLTCQRAMSSEHWNGFLTACFGFLAEHGHVPGAVTASRNSILTGDDWWYPVLVSRPKAARMWYRPGFVSDVGADANWESLLTSLKNGRFCPVIGPGIHHQLQATRLELAREMADEFDFPLAFSNRINLSAVAQYVRTLEPNTEVFSSKLEQRIRKLLLRIAGVKQDFDGNETLRDLAYRVGIELLKREEANPYNLLAKLPVSLYMTTNLDPFLEAALDLTKQEAFGPVQPPLQNVHVFDFTRVNLDKSDADGETALPIVEFSPSEPLVVQLYGSYRRLSDVAIAEDDYFQFLATFAKRIQDVKGPLEGKLGESDLIFLGFKWSSLDFRVLFRALQKYARIMPAVSCHIAVQVDPDDDETIRPDKVLEYLRRYFAGGKHLQQARLSLFWGSTEDFLKELAARI